MSVIHNNKKSHTMKRPYQRNKSTERTNSPKKRNVAKTISFKGSKDAGGSRDSTDHSVESQKRVELLVQALRNANDLASIYAPLKLFRDQQKTATKSKAVTVESLLTSEDQELFKSAALAVPFLLFERAVELCTRPRSMGGLSFSTAKATQVVQLLMATNPSAKKGNKTLRTPSEQLGCLRFCSAHATEKELLKMCSLLNASDARKILPHLKSLGAKARSQVPALREKLDKIGESGNEDTSQSTD